MIVFLPCKYSTIDDLISVAARPLFMYAIKRRLEVANDKPNSSNLWSAQGFFELGVSRLTRISFFSVLLPPRFPLGNRLSCAPAPNYTPFTMDFMLSASLRHLHACLSLPTRERAHLHCTSLICLRHVEESSSPPSSLRPAWQHGRWSSPTVPLKTSQG